MKPIHQTDNKIGAHHLKRKAIVYVRQSSMKQVMENAESTARQYGLVDVAKELGWNQDLVSVIDDDLGKSASSAAHRNGFQKLVADVAMGQVGIVMGLEMSRLARNNADFQQLLQICGTNNTLIYDADAVYDLMRLNDRLVLGLKGTMSEVELYTIRARLQGGALNKAARAELRIKLPVGFVYSPNGKVVLDPDCQVQETLNLFFETFRKIGSSKGVVRHFNCEGIKFPARPIKGADKGTLTWRSLSSGLALRVLHNPRYAGAYAYGRTKVTKSPSGGISYLKRERTDWHSLVKDANPAYITWDEFEKNEEILTANIMRDFRGSAREGRALLQGIVLCGKCGKNFATSYKKKSNGDSSPIYICNREQLDYGNSICTYIPGYGIDEVVENILLEKVTPMALEAAISVQQEIVKRSKDVDKLLSRHVERSQYEADLAKRRVMSVDPENRLVAQTFEEDWNEKLTLLGQAKIEYEKKCRSNRNIIDSEKQDEVRHIAANFTQIWSHRATTCQDKKRMVRLLIEDVTLKRDGYEVDIYIRFKTGLIVKKKVGMRSSGNKRTVVNPKIIQKIEELAERHTAGEIAEILNSENYIHPTIQQFNSNAINYLLKRFKIATLYKKLRANAYLSQEEISKQYGIKTQTVRRWRKLGWIEGLRYNDKPEYLYKPKFDALPANVANQYETILLAN